MFSPNSLKGQYMQPEISQNTSFISTFAKLVLYWSQLAAEKWLGCGRLILAITLPQGYDYVSGKIKLIQI